MRDPVAELGVGFQEVLARRTERMNRSRFWRKLPILLAFTAVLCLIMAAASQRHRWSHLGEAAYFGFMAVSISAGMRRLRSVASEEAVRPPYVTRQLRDRHAGVVLICGIAGGIVAIVWWPHHPVIAVAVVIILAAVLVIYDKLTLRLARRRYENDADRP
jgi:hypothetical protein